jgi:hypothetical protein
VIAAMLAREFGTNAEVFKMMSFRLPARLHLEAVDLKKDS